MLSQVLCFLFVYCAGYCLRQNYGDTLRGSAKLPFFGLMILCYAVAWGFANYADSGGLWLLIFLTASAISLSVAAVGIVSPPIYNWFRRKIVAFARA